MKLRRILLPSTAGLLLAATFATAAPLSKNPGATLIVPYFEVDLDEPDGRSTLVSVGNAGEPVVAHATLWTDRGVPVYAWDIYLGENALVTYNLRDIVVYGNVAPTSAPASFGGCGSPVATPALPAADLALLQKQLTGQRLGNGTCDGEPRQDLTLASGSITIDTVNDCRTGAGQRYPTDAGYFNTSSPRASARKVLWGDFTLVDPAENFAQGYEAHALGLAASLNTYAAFGRWPADTSVARESLNEIYTCSGARFLLDGPFDARTSLFVYTPPPIRLGDNECIAEEAYHVWDFQVFDEDGRGAGAEIKLSAYRTSARFEVGDDIPTSFEPSGYVELETAIRVPGGVNPVPHTFPNQHLLLGAIQASGRFAVGISGDPMSIGSCYNGPN